MGGELLQPPNPKKRNGENERREEKIKNTTRTESFANAYTKYQNRAVECKRTIDDLYVLYETRAVLGEQCAHCIRKWPGVSVGGNVKRGSFCKRAKMKKCTKERQEEEKKNQKSFSPFSFSSLQQQQQHQHTKRKRSK